MNSRPRFRSNKQWLVILGIIILLAASRSCSQTPAFPASAELPTVGPAQIASLYIGKGEEGGDNRGCFVDQVMAQRSGRSLPWCAGFVSFVLHRSGYAGPYRWNAKDFLRDGKRVSVPRPGDLAVFWRGASPSSPEGHVGIVTRVNGGWVFYVDGNHGPYPSKVKLEKMRLGSEPKLLAYVSLS